MPSKTSKQTTDFAPPFGGEKEPRTIGSHLKIPKIAEDKLRAISDKEHRTVSTISYYLLLRGIQAYLNDGLLFTDTNEQRFLFTSPIKKRGGGSK